MDVSCADLSNGELIQLSRQFFIASMEPQNSRAVQRWALRMAEVMQGEISCRHASWLEFTRSADAQDIRDAVAGSRNSA
jgi:hypothetical protein